MDAALAMIFFATSLADMALTDCRRVCLGYAQPPARLSLQVARLEHRDDWSNREILPGIDAPMQHGPIQHSFSLGMSATGDVWIGAGAKSTTQTLLADPFFLETTFQPGLHFRGDGPDIGGSLHFRAGAGIGYEFDIGSTLTISYDHRSNADRTVPNPGLDTLSVRYAFLLD